MARGGGGPGAWRTAGAALLAAALTACAPDPAPAAPATPVPAPHPDADAKASAHAALAARLRPFLIERVVAGRGRSARAADDERFRLGAFWKVRTDTHHFDAAFRARAQAALASAGAGAADARADMALRRLIATVDARLPAWQALVDYNASGRMRDDGGEGGRQRLPGAIAAIDAIEAAAWAYVETAAHAAPAP
ncbi:hypothetical protein [Luteimonas sp. FCS-9]|uniref:hypothetical protein n=1 Tax=Luteimonas sp. FCS-9 TaxID=1547516 RepID=UPI00063E9E1C|nr:hypothetical protein [Luteimonas sp. FCS-9]KLJ01398.1 hypothetical protein WQ56_06475 [Luteimonas sp. FCS-9]